MVADLRLFQLPHTEKYCWVLIGNMKKHLDDGVIGKMARIVPGTFLSALLLLYLTANVQGAVTTFEAPPVLKASQILPAKVKQQGAHYIIDEEVLTDGFLMAFTIRSDFGIFVARSPEILEQRLVEIGALEQLEKVSKSDAFVSGLKDSAKQLGQQVADLVTEPVETVKGIPAGVGSFFDRVSRGAKTGYQKLGDIREKENQTTPPPQGMGAKLPGKSSNETEKGSAITVEEASLRMTGQVTANALGYDEQRRRIAKEVRVDPYSTNPVITKKLDEITNAAFAGGLGISVFKAVVPASLVISTTTLLSDWVWDTAPGTLKVQNERSLKAMGVSPENIDQLLRQPYFTLTLLTRLVKALDKLSITAGRPLILPVAVTVESFDQARFVVEATEMLAQYHETVEPLKILEEKFPFAARTQTGTLVVAGPVDCLSWTEQIQRFASRPDLQVTERVLLLRGEATALATTELTRMSWQVQQHARN